MYNEKSAKDLLAEYPRRMAEGGEVNEDPMVKYLRLMNQMKAEDGKDNPVQTFRDGSDENGVMTEEDRMRLAAILEQQALQNARTELGPLSASVVPSSKKQGVYDVELASDLYGIQPFADVDLKDKKISRIGARLGGDSPMGNYELQYALDPETRQPVVTGVIRKRLSPTSDISAQGTYVPVRGGDDYYNVGMRYTKEFAEGGEVGHPNEAADNVASWGRKQQENIAGLVGLSDEVKFANEIPTRYFSKEEQLDGRGDAMRHLLLQAQIQKKYGDGAAEFAGWLHENVLTGGQSDEEKAMDESNDALGRKIGARSADKADMAFKALQAIKSGEAKTIPKKAKPKKFEKGGEVKEKEPSVFGRKGKEAKIVEGNPYNTEGPPITDNGPSPMDVASFINSFMPVTGDIQSAAEAYQSYKDKDYVGASLGAVGMLPLVPNITKYVKGSAKELEKFFPEMEESKVRDAKGNLAKVFHAGASLETGLPTKGKGIYSEGVYFSGMPSRTEFHGKKTKGGTTYPMYANIKNPISGEEFYKRFKTATPENSKKIRDILVSEGYDGVISKLGDEIWEGVSFFPEKQLKSSISSITPKMKDEMLEKDVKEFNKFKHGGEVTKFIKSKK